MIVPYDDVDGSKVSPGVFLITTRHHGVGEVPAQLEMLPTSLPELNKPSRTPEKPPTTYISEPSFIFRTNRTHPNLCLLTWFHDSVEKELFPAMLVPLNHRGNQLRPITC